MIVLLLALAATTSAGMVLYALHDGAGPLASIVASEPPSAEGGGSPRVLLVLLQHGRSDRCEHRAPRESRASDDHGPQAERFTVRLGK